MSVLFPNASLWLVRTEPGSDAFGRPVAATAAPAVGPFPGRAQEQADGTWNLGLDTALWPVRVKDVVLDETGHRWLVRSVQLCRNEEAPEVDYVQATAVQITDAGVEPGGGHLVARP